MTRTSLEWNPEFAPIDQETTYLMTLTTVQTFTQMLKKYIEDGDNKTQMDRRISIYLPKK
jgi:hypothetical protein